MVKTPMHWFVKNPLSSTAGGENGYVMMNGTINK